ncbi:iron ABC transporter permease, partial [Streptomyces californicus]
MTTLDTRTPPDAVTRRPAGVRLLWLLLSVLALAAVMVASVAFGSRDVPWSDVVAAFGGSDDTLGQAAATKRIPR